MNRATLVLLAAVPSIGLRAEAREVAPMQWHNPPAKWSADKNAITLDVMPKTDYWRTTHYGYNRDSGHFYYREMAGDFVASGQGEGELPRALRPGRAHDPDRRDELDQGGDRVRQQLAERQHRRHPRVLGLVGGSPGPRAVRYLAGAGPQVRLRGGLGILSTAGLSSSCGRPTSPRARKCRSASWPPPRRGRASR